MKFFQDNHGKTEIVISKLFDEKSNNGEYLLSFNIFICNHSLNPKYIKDLKLCFYKRKKIFECPPNKSSNQICLFDIDKKSVVNIIELKYNEPQYLKLQSIFSADQVNKFQKTKKIILKYKNEKGRTKKVTIIKDFSMDTLKIYGNGNGFPIP